MDEKTIYLAVVDGPLSATMQGADGAGHAVSDERTSALVR